MSWKYPSGNRDKRWLKRKGKVPHCFLSYPFFSVGYTAVLKVQLDSLSTAAVISPVLMNSASHPTSAS